MWAVANGRKVQLVSFNHAEEVVLHVQTIHFLIIIREDVRVVFVAMVSSTILEFEVQNARLKRCRVTCEIAVAICRIAVARPICRLCLNASNIRDVG